MFLGFLMIELAWGAMGTHRNPWESMGSHGLWNGSLIMEWLTDYEMAQELWNGSLQKIDF